MPPDPVAEVQKQLHQLQAAGLTKFAALESIFEKDPALRAAYQRKVRSDPKALDDAIKSELARRVAAEMSLNPALSRFDAVFNCLRRDPEMKARFIEASNRPTAATSAAAAPMSLRDARLVDEQVRSKAEALKASRGWPHEKAVVAVFASDEELHQLFLEAHKQHPAALRRR
ncbi:MAG TPA: hypothetical protein VH370_07995 [Humisphaera sp.]|jgi:hypothetical protein|nr:hypothetical protein [Humisphaera sp.]